MRKLNEAVCNINISKFTTVIIQAGHEELCFSPS